MVKMKVKDIQFGNIDARHEILARSPDKRKLFLDSFYTPTSFNITDILNGERFLIVGPKGSGKTAFLRYINHTLDRNPHSKSKFIVFRDEVTAQDKDKIATLANFRIYDANETQRNAAEIQDCTSAWQLFIHRELATIIAKENDLCAKSSDVIDYIKLLDSFFSQFKTSSFKNLLKRITKGKIKLGALGQGLEAEAEFIDKHGNIDISEFLRYCNSVITNLDFNAELSDPRINIFFDEININYVSGKDFQRNAVLVRDLVSACGILNSLFSENGLPIFVYTAIRSDVVDSVESSVRELRKWVDDKGVQLNWMEPQTKHSKQPIIQLLRKRIEANELRFGRKAGQTKQVNLMDYFESQIHGKPFDTFLLYETWARPRDIVRLLSTASEHVSRDGKFNNIAFAKSSEKYSSDCWQEKCDELNSKYSQTAISVIQKVLTGFETTFSYSHFESRSISLSNSDPRVNQFFQGRIIGTVLEDLYRVGVLGNMLKRPNGGHYPAYQYIGHDNFSVQDLLCVHRSLWKVLRLNTGNQSNKKPRRKPKVKRA